MTADILRLEWQPARPTLFGHPVAAQFLERCQPDERSQSFPDGRQDPLGPVGQTVAEGGEKSDFQAPRAGKPCRADRATPPRWRSSAGLKPAAHRAG